MDCKRCGMSPLHNKGCPECRGCGDPVEYQLNLTQSELWITAFAFSLLTTDVGHKLALQAFPEMDQNKFVSEVEKIIEKLHDAKGL